MRKTTFFKTLLVAACLCLGSMSAWATETVLSPTGGVTTVNTGSSDVAYDALATSWVVNQGGVSGGNIGRYVGPYCLVKFDASDIAGTITEATISFDCTAGAYNNNMLVYLLGAADWDATTVVWSTLSSSAKSATNIGSGTWSTKNATANIAYTITGSVTKSLMGFAICGNNAREQTISNIKLTINHTTASVYTATFTETNSLNPTVTIYTDASRTETITNGSLLDETKYYYRAVLEGYQNYDGDFTVAGTNPSVNFTMTAKTPVTSMKVNYTYGGSTIDTDNQSVTGLYVGDSYTAPFHMYIVKDGVLYQTEKETSNPHYGKAVTLEANTAFDKSLTQVNLYGGTIALFEDLNGGTSDNAFERASYCSSYGNMAYTSPENLAVGTYTFIFRGYNRGRGSSVKVGEKTIINASDIGSGWGDKTLYNVNIPTADKLTFVAGASSTIDYYDIIIAIKQTGDIVTVSNAGYATYVSANNLDFTSTSIKAYTAKVNISTGKIVLSKINKVPAGTPVILYKDDGATENIPFAAFTDAVGENDLQVGEGAAVATDGGDGKYNYILNNVSGIGFYKAAGQTVAKDRAYLQTTYNFAEPGARLVMVFADEETTGIQTVQGSEFTVNGYFDLQGRQVAQPTKGLYIVNGKKVVIK